MQIWSWTTVKSLVMPGGILLLGVALLVHSGWLTLALPALSFLYYCALIGGALLAWRFHSSRMFFALLTLFLAQQAMARFDAAHPLPGTPGWIVLRAIWVLVPLNFVVVALIEERGFMVSATAPVALFLFVQTVIVVVLCRAAEVVPSVHGHHAATASLPSYILVTAGAAGVFLLVRTLLSRKPADGALLWSLAAFLLSVYFVGTVRTTTAYVAAAAWILAISIIENSYLLAYHDELTTLPSRRAFNDALLRLQDPFSIAVVDIDHFKRFNDTYGHDTGDEVLRLVAASLARVTGGGQAYRCGGEEFAILFPGRTVPEVVEHLEQLRSRIASAEFRLRSADRRQTLRGPDRRNVRGRASAGRAVRKFTQTPAAALSVTVSIGVAASSMERPHPDGVLEAADKALYRAKDNGRNRVETAVSPRRRRTKAAGIA